MTNYYKLYPIKGGTVCVFLVRVLARKISGVQSKVLIATWLAAGNNTSITGFNNNTTGIVIVDTVAVTKNEPM